MSRATRRRRSRNQHWFHLYSADVISMPDKWEYPWFAAWDLAFHAVALAFVDPDFAREQLDADAARSLPAPERPAARVRVELRRRQPARSRLGEPVQLSARTARAWATTRVPFLKRTFHMLIVELHLVAQPQGSRRPQPVRGRVPRPRQHRRVRSQRAAADGRLPGASGRHGLDGAVLRPEHARHGAGAGAGRPDLRGPRGQVLRTRDLASPPP